MVVGDGEMRLDELAQQAGVPTTTVRLYQNKGLLPRPRLVGRTGYYGPHHLTRLALIARLQSDGFSLAAIARLLETWESGRALGDLVGVEGEFGALLGTGREVELTAAELTARFPAGAVTAESVNVALESGLIEPLADGRFRVPDRRFLDTGAALIALGVPAAVVLAEWGQLSTATDEIAARFVNLFESHLLPQGFPATASAAEVAALAATLRQLRETATQVVIAALETSMGNEARRRLADIVDTEQRPAVPEPEAS
jgi:DNA-binding transcriptional MerR regulator